MSTTYLLVYLHYYVMKCTSSKRRDSLGSLSGHILNVCSSCSGRDAIHFKKPRNLGIIFRAVQVGEMGEGFS